MSTKSCKTAPGSLLFSPLERRAPSACRCWLRKQRNPSSFNAIPSSIVHRQLQNCPRLPPLQSARAKSALSLQVLAPKAAKSPLILCHSELHCPQRAAKLPQTPSSSVRQSENALSLQVLAPKAAKSPLILCHSELHCP